MTALRPTPLVSALSGYIKLHQLQPLVMKTAATCMIALSCLLSPSAALAQVLDQVEVQMRQVEADIVVHFAQKIVYTRHVPLHEGKVVRIFFKPVDEALHYQGFAQETLWTTENGRIPKASISYQHRDDGLEVEFTQQTKYRIRAGRDGRSIIITIPAVPAPEEREAPDAAPAEAPTRMPAAPVSAAKAADASPPSAVAAATERALPAIPSVPAESSQQPTTPVMSMEEVEAKAKREMQDARQALTVKDGATAANRLYRILGLPPNSQTEEAQALVGEARQLKGEMERARAEFELYLKLFPKGTYLAQVRSKLDALDKKPVPEKPKVARKAAAKKTEPAEWKINGSVAAYYYTGSSKIETLVPPPPGELTFNRETLDAVDQNSLITSLNLNARRRDADTDMRVVLRDTDNRNFLDPDRSYNRLYSAYFERTDKPAGYFVRAGRQNPDGGGVLDRFDGISGAYDLSPRWRAHAVYGNAIEFDSPFDKTFYGGSIELLGDTGMPGVNLYAIEQTLDGFENRRAIGTEVRYFNGRASAYGLLDYDLHYNGINIALLQGNYLDEKGNNYFVVYDHRRASSYSLITAMMGAPGVSLKDLIAVQGIDAVRDQVTALSAKSDMFTLGMTHQFTERWQLGADYRRSSISSTEPVTVVMPLELMTDCTGFGGTIEGSACVFNTAAIPGSGVSHVLTLQAIGNNLLAKNAVGVGNLSYIMAPTYTGTNLGLIYLIPIGEKWHLDANLRYYWQKGDNGDKQTRISPSLRVSYQWKNNWFFEGEVGREISDTDTSSISDHTVRDYLYFGIRWDFQK